MIYALLIREPSMRLERRPPGGFRPHPVSVFPPKVRFVCSAIGSGSNLVTGRRWTSCTYSGRPMRSRVRVFSAASKSGQKISRLTIDSEHCNGRCLLFSLIGRAVFRRAAGNENMTAKEIFRIKNSTKNILLSLKLLGSPVDH